MAEASEPVVRCAQCLTVLAEPPNTPPENRQPCPKCGATSRNYAVHLSATLHMQPDIVVGAGAASATASAPPPRVVIDRLSESGYRLDWLRLSDGGAWMLRVYDDQGTFIDGSVQDDPGDALLAVAERLLPKS